MQYFIRGYYSTRKPIVQFYRRVQGVWNDSDPDLLFVHAGGADFLRRSGL